MAKRWYQKDTVQASVVGAVIGGTAVLGAAFIGGMFSLRSTPPLPPLEIRTVSQGAEHVLSRLALRPDRQLIDSLAFGQLKPEFVVLSDSFGIAIREPGTYAWSAGRFSEVGGISPSHIPYFDHVGERFRSAFRLDTLPDLDTYGVRRDHPVTIRLTRRSAIADIPIDENPYRWQEYADAEIDLLWADEARDFTPRERRLLREHWSAQVDSIIDAKTPIEEVVHTGVFIRVIPTKRLQALAFISPWSYFDPFEAVLLMHATGAPAPRFFFVDEDSKVGVFNSSLRLRSVEVDGAGYGDVIYNSAGYIVSSRDVVFVVSIRYLSTEGEIVVQELERFFDSVRLRADRVGQPG